MSEIEEWRDVPEYEGLYQISSYGNVKSLNYRRTGKEQILKPSIDGNGYYKINLYKNNKQKSKRIHILVAICFLGHTPDGTNKIVVDHRDTIKLNNNLSNLQLITNRENCSKDRTGGSSKYTGVYWNRQMNKWKSEIQIKGKLIYLGYYDEELEAAEIYQKALVNIKQYNGDRKSFMKYLKRI